MMDWKTNRGVVAAAAVGGGGWFASWVTDRLAYRACTVAVDVATAQVIVCVDCCLFELSYL